MIIMIIGGNKEQRLNLTDFIGKNIPNFVVRRSIFHPIKEVVSNNNKENKLSLIKKDLSFIGDTTDFIVNDKSTMDKIEVVKDSFDLAFDKDYLLQHFNKGLSHYQFLVNTGRKSNDPSHKPVFIIDDIERKDDLEYLESNLKKRCLESNHTLGKSLFSSMKHLLDKNELNCDEQDKIRMFEQNREYSDRENSSDISYPEILKIVIKDEKNCISQVYPGATIKTTADIETYENVIELNSSDSLNTKSENLSLLLYNLFYSKSVKQQLKGA